MVVVGVGKVNVFFIVGTTLPDFAVRFRFYTFQKLLLHISAPLFLVLPVR